MILKKGFLAIFLGTNLFFMNTDAVSATDTNVSLAEELYKQNAVILFNESKFAPSPQVISPLSRGMETLSFVADIHSYDKSRIYYFVLYEKDKLGNIKESFRVRLDRAGRFSVSDKNILSAIKNNQVYLARIESYKIEEGIFTQQEFSDFSSDIYASKEYTFNVRNEDKIIYSENIVEGSPKVIGNKLSIDVSKLQSKFSDAYYTYVDSKIYEDTYLVEVLDNKIELDYYTEELRVDVDKNISNWEKLTIDYPSPLAKDITIFAKEGENFTKFREDNSSLFTNFSNSRLYKFLGYYVDGVSIADYVKPIDTELKITAVFESQAVVKNDLRQNVYLFKTGEKLADIVDLSLYEKAGYNIISYTITDNISGISKTVDDLADYVLTESVTIEPNYQVKKYKINIVQDDYNSRFGSVESGLVGYTKEWEANKPLGELLSELASKISPNSGYDLYFRILKKEVDANTLITNDSPLEIYFKKKDSDWVNVVFEGEGIDKFLSDGQKVLAGQRIDSINLPTSQGSTKEFLGWSLDTDFDYDLNGKTIVKEPNSILKNIDLAHIKTRPRQDLIFKAVYIEDYEISLSSKGKGSVSLVDGATFRIKSNENIGQRLKDSGLIINPEPHFTFSHFTADKNIYLESNTAKSSMIKAGEKISLEEFYKLEAREAIKFEAHFVPYYSNFNNIIFMEDEDFGLSNQNKNYSSSLERALGPLNFLR